MEVMSHRHGKGLRFSYILSGNEEASTLPTRDSVSTLESQPGRETGAVFF